MACDNFAPCNDCMHYYMNGGKCCQSGHTEDLFECPFDAFHYSFDRPDDADYIKLKSYIDAIIRYYDKAKELIDNTGINGGMAIDWMSTSISKLGEEYDGNKLKEFLEISG